MSPSRHDALAIAIVALIALASLNTYIARLSLATDPKQHNSLPRPKHVNATFTYFDYAYITYVNGSSSSNTTAYFDIPTNYSDGALNQTVHIIAYGGNVSVGGGKNNASVSIELFNGSQGFVVAKVVESFLNDTAILTYIARHPTAFKFTSTNIPAAIRRKYVRRPAEVVVKYVVPAFRKWLSKLLSNSSIELGNVSKAFIAVLAAYFIYISGYIRYSASAMPRTLNETVIKRVGDCDDMSRVLTNLLWYYGIPAKIDYGYVYIPSFNVTVTLERSAIRFLNNGPHAFVTAYIPGLKWVSLDFLAGSLLNNPFLIQYASTKAVVTRKDIQKIRKELSQFKYAEEVQVYEDHLVPAFLNTTSVNELLKVLHEEALPVIALAKPKHNIVSTTPTTSGAVNTTITTRSSRTTNMHAKSTATQHMLTHTSTTTTPAATTEASTTHTSKSLTLSTTSASPTTGNARASKGRITHKTVKAGTQTLKRGARAEAQSSPKPTGVGGPKHGTEGVGKPSTTATASKVRIYGARQAYVLGFIGCLAVFALVLLIVLLARPSVRIPSAEHSA